MVNSDIGAFLFPWTVEMIAVTPPAGLREQHPGQGCGLRAEAPWLCWQRGPGVS